MFGSKKEEPTMMFDESDSEKCRIEDALFYLEENYPKSPAAISRRTLYRLLNKGEGPTRYKDAWGRVLYEISDLDEWAKKRNNLELC